MSTPRKPNLPRCNVAGNCRKFAVREYRFPFGYEPHFVCADHVRDYLERAAATTSNPRQVFISENPVYRIEARHFGVKLEKKEDVKPYGYPLP